MGNDMIQVAGRPFSLESTTDFGRVERAILQQMLDSSEWFSYSSMNELRFELNVRINIMESAKEMNASQVTFTIFEHASCNPEYWTLTSTGGFLVRSDVRPSDAILDIYRNGTLYGFECATAIIIIYYQAILKSIGQLRFDSIFQHLYLYSWHTHPGLELHTFHADRFLPGDVVYFNNPDFHPDTPWFRGENAVVLSDGTFFGHGFGIMTAEQMIQSLNSYRFPGSMQPAYLANLITRISPLTIRNLLTLQSDRTTYHYSKAVIHHNLCSISSMDYQYYLLSLNG
ncbi:protein-glutamine gamma-glutamyltransferase [Halalkalibacterium halodurans]|jgi:protein-glutamine gamma-glutamyltransferase|uniref:Protein-glutamine gamma-glutamyltransferase n=2 Tax=Halalkalibacterium halodurans TaxID=86665 RepID=TGL_HALH5|nr:RecName: Full=Protein-glutamine gamma-glutamyltransferase; AltName: Full=Transglutaminase; Short=TGase [Halalkalibacterium halodurans C-125]TPE69201.1 protein-glutamine gamma-glutamyltransferase [Halalkalibacterium halodurans]BAB07689.1 transglutaminase [Halalkalibacterium halodurans C-125]